MSWKCSEEFFSHQVKSRDPLKLGFVLFIAHYFFLFFGWGLPFITFLESTTLWLLQLSTFQPCYRLWFPFHLELLHNSSLAISLLNNLYCNYFLMLNYFVSIFQVSKCLGYAFSASAASMASCKSCS